MAAVLRSIDDSPYEKLERVLAEQGPIATLRMLNSRAPHRYTGIYKYTPTILQNIYLVDAFDPSVTKGADVALEDAYCVLLADRREVAFGEATDAPCAVKLQSPVVSYCGALIMRDDGTPFGSLCHYDVARCQRPALEMPFLQAIAPLLMKRLEAEGF